ncbi:hypothetical protein OCH239_13150 [Roseivivax halodurans JCM 10272]|uniref:Aminoglycoside phosphotransferase domain-containing protein n=1 Tax=Roseivivax halodurans JCM 10272 TaxID=1449350 RepID=X7ED42_9RHOB|nr:DUF6206 family protein [Roseivivax halodurans]ETX13121.1 hypothetical protein OCH239_13150 [Roseivivax halodurans JCM 10272]
MTEADPLRELIRADEAARGRTISRLGYFCAPFRPAQGPYSDRVIKVYRGLKDDTALDRLAAAHDAYVTALAAAGVPLPQTVFHLIEQADGTRVPVIVQEALPDDSLMRPRMQTAGRQETLAMMEAAGQVIADFWHAVDGTDDRIGFHPSIRNFAIVDGRAVFFDTFPPLIHYTREEMGRVLLQFSDKTLMRMVGPLMQRRVTGIQDEWYSPPATLVGLVGSACRLRPEYAEDYLDWARGFARRRMEPWTEEALAGLQKPPRLPGYWTGFRRILGLQGEPNV